MPGVLRFCLDEVHPWTGYEMLDSLRNPNKPTKLVVVISTFAYCMSPPYLIPIDLGASPYARFPPACQCASSGLLSSL